MHFIVTRISEERELACDDRAIKSCGDQLIYAKSLLKGARQLVGEKKQNPRACGFKAGKRAW